jgi:hypothetical protein
MTVALACERAAEAGDQTRHLSQGGRDDGRWAAVGHDPGRLPFLRVAHPLTGSLRALLVPGLPPGRIR